MKENSLLASVALFSELYNNDKYNSIFDIIAEFIKGAISLENKWSVTSVELTDLLYSVYQFKIPEAVIKSTLKNKLKDVAKFVNGQYQFDTKISADFIEINKDYKNINDSQQDILNDLITYIRNKENRILEEKEKAEIIENFSRYLLDNGVAEKYSNYISAFVIKNQNQSSFKNTLNLIREGIILYQGIRYTADLNELGKWNTDLNIFLDTEHLFNALGYNGVLFSEIFDDFYKLVTEINFSNKNRNVDKKIFLGYLEETQEEINIFFRTAELIFKGKMPLDPTRPAMKEALKGCKDLSDIKEKKIKFELDLKQKGILLKEFKQSIYNYHDYNVEDAAVIQELRKESESKGRYFDENSCRQIMKIFTKINFYRGGESKNKFENVGSIFITGNRFSLHLAHHTKIKFQENDIPFAKDIEFMTTKFWFKLKKGFSDKQNLPVSFDVVTKAQIILSYHVNQSIAEEFHDLQNKFNTGELSKVEALERSYQLREKSVIPDDITSENIDSSLGILNDEYYFQDLYNEKIRKDKMLDDTIKHNEQLLTELQNIKDKETEQTKIQQQLDFDKRKDDFIITQWKMEKNIQWKNFGYFLLVQLITLLPIIIAFTLKCYKNFDDKIAKLGIWQYAIWSVLVLLFLIEVIGRSYIFNKEKVKLGWMWFTYSFDRIKFNYMKDAKIEAYNKIFEN